VISNGGVSGATHAFKGRVTDEALWQVALDTRRLSRGPSVTEAAGGQNMIASSSPKPARPAIPPPAEQRYHLKGKVISIERELRQVTIEHEEIKGYMENDFTAKFLLLLNYT